MKRFNFNGLMMRKEGKFWWWNNVTRKGAVLYDGIDTANQP